jgi:hypothetical protein
MRELPTGKNTIKEKETEKHKIPLITVEGQPRFHAILAGIQTSQKIIHLYCHMPCHIVAKETVWYANDIKTNSLSPHPCESALKKSSLSDNKFSALFFSCKL